jgi:hypothetical protein
MKNINIKFSTVSNEVEKVVSAESSSAPNKRIDQEGLFQLFTANIIKLRKRFTR